MVKYSCGDEKMYNQDLTLLSEGQIWGNDNEPQLEVMRKYGTIAAITDLCVLTGGFCEVTQSYTAPDDNSLKGRTGWFYTKSSDGNGDVRVDDKDGFRWDRYRYDRSGSIRPSLLSSSIFAQIFPNRVRGYNGTEEVEY